MKGDSLTKALSDRAKYLQLLWANNYQELQARAKIELQRQGPGGNAELEDDEGEAALASYVLRNFSEAQMRFQDVEEVYFVRLTKRAQNWRVR